MTANGRRAVRLEHRLTRPAASLDDLEAAVVLAAENELVALTVSPWLVRPARRLLGRSSVQLGTVVGYPHGGQLPDVKAFEASKALEQGTSQVDFALNAGALASGDDDAVHQDMLAVVEMAHSARALVGVIVEPEALPDELVRRACRLAERAGVDYVVTGTDEASPRRAVERVTLLREACGPRVQVKAAGRFRRADDVHAAAAVGATRVAGWLSAALVREALDVAPAVAAR
jgi:deoxyribose-phosphate aldolase